MRLANESTTRKANLSRRQLFDFVSPTLVGMAVLLYFAFLTFDIHMHRFQLGWDHDTFQRGLVISITNLLLVALGAWNLYGRKSNPHQSLEDRARQVTVNLRSFLYVSMVMSIFFMTEAAADVYDLDFLDAFLMSVYFQVIALLSLGHALRGLKLQDINFDVYKGDGTPAT